MKEFQLNFRLLKADEIECRVGSQTDKGVSLLLYKDARVDMRLLDETVGVMNWKRSHELINGNLFCTVSIFNKETGEWVSKQDVGVESNTEKEKGQASDAFKRACFNWGIGRELYTSPFIWINLSNGEWRINKVGSKKPITRFYVDTIDYTDGRVTKLIIKDDRGTIRFSMGAGKSDVKNEQAGELSYDDKLGAAVLDVQACETEKQLSALYHAYKGELGEDERFIDALKQRKAEIIKK